MTPSKDRVLNKLREEIAPCPFCGGAAEINHIGNEHTKSRGFEVKCLTWGCATKKRAMVIRQPLEKARGFAIAAWNRRADPLVEELRGALEAIRDLEPEPYEGFPAGWDEQVKACPECQRYADHPIQRGICDDHRRDLSKRDHWDEDRRNAIGWRAKALAREALALPVGGGSAREPAQATQVSSDPTANADDLRKIAERVAADIVRLEESAGYPAHHGTPRARDDRRWNRDFADDLRALLAALPHPDTSRHVDGAGWETIDSAPRNGTRLMLWDAKRGFAVSGCWHTEPTRDDPNGFDPGWSWWTADEDIWLWDGGPDDAPTHWRPLPEPPAALAQPDPLTETSGRVDGGDRG